MASYRSYRGYNFDSAYTSHAHGWSSGPTPALTTYVLGLMVVSPQGKTWSVSPHVNSGLPSAEGGFETPLGWYGTKWTLIGTSSRTLTLNLTTPTGTSGTLVVPKDMGGTLMIDGVTKGIVSAGATVALQGGVHIVKLTT